ncbi:hypothetical protein SAMN04487769_3423 [Burkholderia sp. b14]|nr:hypothetical protein SAMN04487769_3423 [Burkholderia sp. b14]
MLAPTGLYQPYSSAGTNGTSQPAFKRRHLGLRHLRKLSQYDDKVMTRCDQNGTVTHSIRYFGTVGNPARH